MSQLDRPQNSAGPQFGDTEGADFLSRGSWLLNPMSILDWSRDKSLHPTESMKYHKALWEQVFFVRDSLANIVPAMGAVPRDRVFVVGHHLSKSIQCPVYELRWEGATFLLRNNFHDWKVTVESQRPMDLYVDNLFDTAEVINPIYCEGFPKSRVHGAYDQRNEDAPKFTFAARSKYEVWMIFKLFQACLADAPLGTIG